MRKRDFKRLFEACGFSFDNDGWTDLKCFRCGKPLKIVYSRLKCENRHRYSYIGYAEDFNFLMYDIKRDLQDGKLLHIDTINDDEDLPKVLEVCDVR